MTTNFRRSGAILLAATMLATPAMAHAAEKCAPHKAHKGGHHAAAPAGPSAREVALEERLARLEGELSQLRGDLASARAGQAQTQAVAQAATISAAQATSVAQTAVKSSSDATTRVAALEKKPAPEGMRSGATTLKIGGYLKLETAFSHFDGGTVTTNTLGRDFYLPQTIPMVTPASHATSTNDFTAKQTRLWVNLDTTVAGHAVKGYLETDFQVNANPVQNVTGGGSQRTTNGYTLGLRRAYMQVDRFTFGQDWTTFQYVGALPESTDYVGATEGTVFVRQPLVRYSAPLGNGLMLHVSAENPESGTANVGAAALTENGTDHMPDFAARLVYSGKRGELSLAGLLRQVRVENAGVGVTATGAGFSAAGKLFLSDSKASDIRFMATYGSNIGRYVGLNFAPDAVFDPAANQLHDVKVFAGLVAARLAITPQLRTNLIASYQNVSYDSALALASLSAYNKKAYSFAANLFYSPAKPIDLGIEYRRGERDLVSGASGHLDRIELAAKYSF